MTMRAMSCFCFAELAAALLTALTAYTCAFLALQTVKQGSDAASHEKQLQDTSQRLAALMKKLEEREVRIKQLESAQDLSRQPSRDRLTQQPLTGVSREDLEQLRMQLEMATRDAQLMNKKLQEKEERIQLLENECVRNFVC